MIREDVATIVGSIIVEDFTAKFTIFIAIIVKQGMIKITWIVSFISIRTLWVIKYLCNKKKLLTVDLWDSNVECLWLFWLISTGIFFIFISLSFSFLSFFSRGGRNRYQNGEFYFCFRKREDGISLFFLDQRSSNSVNRIIFAGYLSTFKHFLCYQLPVTGTFIDFPAFRFSPSLSWKEINF